MPEIYDKVPRHARVRVRALDRSGEPREFDAEGLLAVAVQHEMDHLLGKVFVEYLSPLKRTRIKTRDAEEDRATRAQRSDGGNARARRMRLAFAGTPEFARVALAQAARRRLSRSRSC